MSKTCYPSSYRAEITEPASEPEPCVGCGRGTRGRRLLFEQREIPACSDTCARAYENHLGEQLPAWWFAKDPRSRSH